MFKHYSVKAYSYFGQIPIHGDLWQRRYDERVAWKKLFIERQPNYWLTLTFNEGLGGRAVATEVAFGALDFFFKRMLRRLLGSRYAKKRDKQPCAIAFLEHGSTFGAYQAGTCKPLNSPHFHLMMWIPAALVEKFEGMDLEQTWRGINPQLHRSVDVDTNDTFEKLANRSWYITKQYPWAPIDREYEILGNSNETLRQRT